jgi:hypothetical protein
MKNHIKRLGIIALLAVIGLSFAACGDSEPEPEKTIVITEIPAEYLTDTRFYIAIYIEGATNRPVAMAKENPKLTGSTVTIDLYSTQTDGSMTQASDDRWTGKGTFIAEFWVTKGVNMKLYYANINFKDAVTTIPFSKFHLE